MTTRGLYLSALTGDTGDSPRTATQYGVRRDGRVTIYGDQGWVADGRAVETLGGGLTVRRSVQITYGPWVPADTPSHRAAVFWYPHTGYCGPGWTWCWVIDGEPMDAVWNLPRSRPTWRPVYDEAVAAVRAELEGQR